MKATNILTGMALCSLLALASCSQDDEQVKEKATDTIDPSKVEVSVNVTKHNYQGATRANTDGSWNDGDILLVGESPDESIMLIYNKSLDKWTASKVPGATKSEVWTTNKTRVRVLYFGEMRSVKVADYKTNRLYYYNGKFPVNIYSYGYEVQDGRVNYTYKNNKVSLEGELKTSCAVVNINGVTAEVKDMTHMANDWFGERGPWMRIPRNANTNTAVLAGGENYWKENSKAHAKDDFGTRIILLYTDGPRKGKVYSRGFITDLSDKAGKMYSVDGPEKAPSAWTEGVTWVYYSAGETRTISTTGTITLPSDENIHIHLLPKYVAVDKARELYGTYKLYTHNVLTSAGAKSGEGAGAIITGKANETHTYTVEFSIDDVTVSNITFRATFTK